jgi:hypothetical protein
MSEQSPPAAPLPPEQVPGAEARRQYQEQLAVNDNNSNTLARPAAQTVAVQPERAALSAPSSQSGRTQLCIALSNAQQAIGRVAHDSRTTGGAIYQYTSSEAIIEVAKQALGDNGLAILPLEETLNGHEREGPDRFELVCKFVLLHISGEAQPLLRHWPVCPQNGRPLDKATATASTLCLAYLLRDLLLIPRVNPEDEVAARQDAPSQAARPQKPAKKPAKKPDRPGRGMPVDGAELFQRLKDYDAKLSQEGLCDAGELVRAIRDAGKALGYPEEIARWTGAQIAFAVREVKQLEAAARAQEKPVDAN